MKPFLTLAALALLCPAAAAQVRPLAERIALADPRGRLPGNLGAAEACAVGDFDGDGVVDLARAGGGRITILVQSRSGVFAERPQPATLGVSGVVSALVQGDFDGDGDLDLVVGLRLAEDQVLLNDGTGRFGFAPVGSIPPGSSLATTAIVAGDFDRRGGMDLLLFAANAAPRLLFSAVGGSFFDLSSRLPAAAQVVRLTGSAADFDGDGDLDLALLGTRLSPTIVLWNPGNGDFAAGTSLAYAAANGFRSVAVADLDGDRLPELVLGPEVTGFAAPHVVRVSRTGLTRIPPVANGVALDGWRALALGDYNGDLNIDLAALDESGSLRVAPGNGAGAFGTSMSLLDAGGRLEICAVDLEPDGDLDLFVPGTTAPDALLLGGGSPPFLDTESHTIQSNPGGDSTLPVPIDLTGEGDPDLLVASRAGRFATFQNDGGARFLRAPLAPPDQSSLGSIAAVLVGRLRRGAPLDALFVVGQPSPAALSGVVILQRDLAAGWLDRSGMIVGSQVGRLVTAGTTAVLGRAGDVLAPTSLLLGDAAGRVFALANDGTTITESVNAVPHVHSGAIRKILVRDLDGDGVQDLLVLAVNSPPEFHRGSGTQGSVFTHRPGVFPTITPATDAVIEDFNRDGRLDVFCVTPGSPEGVTIFFGTPSGAWLEVTQRELGLAPRTTTARSIVSLGPADARVTVLGRVDGPPLSLTRSATGPFVVADGVEVRGSTAFAHWAVADFDLDGDDDLVGTRDDTQLTVLLRSERGIAARGPAQIGRQARFDVFAPSGHLCFVLMSPLVTRIEIPPLGILRLLGPATLLGLVSPPTGASALELVVPLGLPPGELPLQLVTLDPLTQGIAIGGLERVVLSDG
ncbi:MAG: FG-GAP repeat domain-containing protein [Planctomycetota bacterium]